MLTGVACVLLSCRFFSVCVYVCAQGQGGGGVQEAAAAVPVPAAPPAPAAGSVWQVHHTQEGRTYYYNSSTGVTQWEVPPGMQ